METLTLIVNISAILLGFSIAFFGNWAYSSEAPYKTRHLKFIIPLLIGEGILAIIVVLGIWRDTQSYIARSGYLWVAVALAFLLCGRIMAIRVEWVEDKKKREKKRKKKLRKRKENEAKSDMKGGAHK